MEKPNQFSEIAKSGLGQVKKMMENPDDIISVIKEDHKPLKELIKVMKDAENPFQTRMDAFREFAPLLITHAKAEEKSLYEFMKKNVDLKEHAFEGDTEHGIADQLAEETKRAADQDEVGAKIKVLAELVEHHIQEEEDEIFPEVKKQVSKEVLQDLTRIYVQFQEQVISEGQDDSPHEADLTKGDLKH